MKKVSNFRDRLNQLLTTTKVTALEVSERTGISSAAISRYRNGLRNARSEHVEIIANMFDVPVAWILGYKEEVSAPTEKIPVISTVIKGKPMFADSNVEDYLTIPARWGVDFAYRVTDGIMFEAGISEEALVLIHMQPDANDGQIALMLVDDVNVVLRRVKRQDTLLLLEPANIFTDTMIFSGKEKNRVKVIGVVKKIIHEM